MVVRTRTAVVLTLLAMALVVGGAWAWRHRATADERLAVLCEQIAGPDGWRYVPGAGCYDVNPWTGTVTAVDLG